MEEIGVTRAPPAADANDDLAGCTEEFKAVGVTPKRPGRGLGLERILRFFLWRRAMAAARLIPPESEWVLRAAREAQ